MKSRLILTGLALVLLSLALVAAPLRAAQAGAGSTATQPDMQESPSVQYQTNFEKTIQPWEAGTNDRSVTASLSRQEGDNGCGDGGNAFADLESYPGPIQDAPEAGGPHPLPITTWAAIELSGPRGPVDVTVEWATRNQGACEGCMPAVFVGTQAIDDRSLFHTIASPLSKQWQSLSYQTTFLYGNTGTIYVALGWMGSNAAIALDCVSISINAHYDYDYSFENGTAPWQPVEMNDETPILNQGAGDAGCSRRIDTWHAALSNYLGPLDSETDVGPLAPLMLSRMMQASFPPSSDRFSDVTVTWSARSDYGCAGCTPLIYLGTSPLTSSGQLRPLAAKIADFWQPMGYEAAIFTPDTSHVYVALGWQEPAGPTRLRAVGYDCLNVHIQPADINP